MNESLEWRQHWRHFFIVSILGLSSGLPFAILSTTVIAWCASYHVSIKDIGLMALAMQPYGFKFLWAPLLDQVQLPGWLNRRQQILFCQGLLLFICLSFSQLLPTQHFMMIGAMSFLLGIVSATQDIAIDGYRTELLKPKARGLGATLAVLCYRLATIVSGVFALLVADNLGWPVVFIGLSFMILLLALFFMVAYQPASNCTINTVRPKIWDAFYCLYRKPSIGLIMVFIFCFKLAEAFTSTSSPLVIPFLMNSLHYTMTEIAFLNKAVGISATILGSLLTGILLFRVTLYRLLCVTACFQCLTNALFIVLSCVGKHSVFLALVIGLDNLVAGMGMAGLLAFMMGVCDKRFAASHFAILSALSAQPRAIASVIGGYFQVAYGWFALFLLATLLAVPAIIVLIYLKKEVDGLSKISNH